MSVPGVHFIGLQHQLRMSNSLEVIFNTSIRLLRQIKLALEVGIEVANRMQSFESALLPALYVITLIIISSDRLWMLVSHHDESWTLMSPCNCLR
jgi:hypothetical protein